MPSGGGKLENLQDRYSLLLRPGVDPDSGSDDEEESEKKQAYAAFLKDKERKCGPDGFLDSHRYKNQYTTEKKKKDKNDDKSKSLSTVDLMAKKERDQKEFEQRLKIIEDHMWQHKQEERELKRVEGDVIKNQRIVRRTLRDYENAVTRKRLSEEKKLNQSLDKYTKLQQKELHRKEELNKQRTEQNVQNDQSYKDMGRKVQLTTSQLAREYRTKMGQLELRKVEAERLSQDYSNKLRHKEEEQFRLKQELAELAISLNMEAQKGRQQETDYQKNRKKERVQRIDDDKTKDKDINNQVAKSDGDTKNAIMQRRKLSADLTLTRAHLSLKQREDSRQKKDTENRLRTNVNEQKQLNDAAMHAEMDLKSRKIDQKIEEHNTRKRVAHHEHWKQRKETSVQSEANFSQKAQVRHIDQQRREHEDHLKHFQRSVNKGQEIEYALYNRVKNAEYARQKQEQSVRKMQTKLYEVRRVNKSKLKEEMTEMSREEREMEYKLQREQARLAKVHAAREETYERLQHHRDHLREERYQLQEHEREHNRLVRVGQRSDALAQSYA